MGLHYPDGFVNDMPDPESFKPFNQFAGVSRSETAFERGQRYTWVQKLGNGSFGTVHLFHHEVFGNVAIKEFSFSGAKPFSSTSLEKNMIRELSLASRLRGAQFVVQALDVVIAKIPESATFTEHQILGLVLELAVRDLKTHMTTQWIRGATGHMYQVRRFMRQLLLGLKHCHSLGIVNRDIKEPNILIYNSREAGSLDAYIADFGLGRATPLPTPLVSGEIGTPLSRPPEAMMIDKTGTKRTNSTAFDIWGLGMVFLNMIYVKEVAYDYIDTVVRRQIPNDRPDVNYWERSVILFIYTYDVIQMLNARLGLE